MICVNCGQYASIVSFIIERELSFEKIVLPLGRFLIASEMFEMSTVSSVKISKEKFLLLSFRIFFEIQMRFQYLSLGVAF